MPISANAVWNIVTTATGTAGKNGGFFVAGASGTNYSLQNGAQYALTGVTSGGAGNTILTASAAADMVGNGIFVVSGTNYTLNAWFEITSVVVGVSITCSTNAAGAAICVTGVGSAGVMNIGGANHLNSTLADDMFEAGAAGNTYYIKSGSYTLGESFSFTRDGTTLLPISITGYTATQGDACTGSSRPTLLFATLTWTCGAYYNVKNLIATGSAAVVVTAGPNNRWFNVKVINFSATALRAGLEMDGSSTAINCEAICYRGYAFVGDSASDSMFFGCYAHDSHTGFRLTNATYACSLIGCTVAACYTYGINVSDATPGQVVLKNSTIMGRATTPLGVGVFFAGVVHNVLLLNNIITGCATGLSGSATSVKHSWSEYNDWFGNTVDVTNWTKGSTDIAIAPAFTNVTQVSGATATTAASNRLVQAGATFIASGVTAGRDYVYIASGTGVTAGVYGIASVDSETQLTLDITLAVSAVADKVFYIHCGHNYAIGVALKADASPLTGNPDTTTYLDPGSAQRQEPTATTPAFAYFGS